MLRNYRKPLVLATPKIGLKHIRAISSIEEMITGTKFQPLLVNEFGKSSPHKIVICTGKVFFDM